jgi:hypothetical protein
MGTADAAVLAVVERALDPELLADLYGLIFAPEPTRCSSSRRKAWRRLEKRA